MYFVFVIEGEGMGQSVQGWNSKSIANLLRSMQWDTIPWQLALSRVIHLFDHLQNMQLRGQFLIHAL